MSAGESCSSKTLMAELEIELDECLSALKQAAESDDGLLDDDTKHFQDYITMAVLPLLTDYYSKIYRSDMQLSENNAASVRILQLVVMLGYYVTSDRAALACTELFNAMTGSAGLEIPMDFDIDCEMLLVNQK